MQRSSYKCSSPPQSITMPYRYDDTVRTLIFTGRPLRVLKTPYISEWEGRQQEIQQLCAKGTIPFYKDLEEKGAELMKQRPLLMGQVANALSPLYYCNNWQGCGSNSRHQARS
jgi:NAD(P)H-dependent flavin oxidoreductase YrpB (nitropropane dioxygenase family)